MRIDLQCPFQEKDEAKALGARWDAGRKVWYVIDPRDLAPFMRWMPQAKWTQLEEGAQCKHGATDRRKARSSQSAKFPDKRRRENYGAPKVTRSVYVAHCGCDVLPWDDCQHTAQAEALADAGNTGVI